MNKLKELTMTILEVLFFAAWCVIFGYLLNTLEGVLGIVIGGLLLVLLLLLAVILFISVYHLFQALTNTEINDLFNHYLIQALILVLYSASIYCTYLFIIDKSFYLLLIAIILMAVAIFLTIKTRKPKEVVEDKKE